MTKLLLLILDWSEVWALLIPLFALIRKQPAFLKPVVIYLWVALVINIIIDIIMGMNVYTHSFLQSNNPLYNLHSIVRFVCFSIYFVNLKQGSFLKLRKVLPLIFGSFILVNFIFFENFLNASHLSGNLMATESYILLVYCMQYYLGELKNEDNVFKGKDFWIVTGLGIYVVINFFAFLFYVPMLDTNTELATNIWNLHNISYIVFCLFITKAFYVPTGNKYTS